jgi:FkbM family methyltransferase
MWEYLKVRLRVFLFGKLLKRKPGAERVFGYQVFPDSYPTFGMLVSEIFVIREYEFKTERERPLIIDCGGNIGLSTLYFSMQNPQARIMTFEPAPGTFARLKKMKEVNGLNQVELHNVAVAENEGEIDLYLEEGNEGSAIASKYAEFGTVGGKVKVRAVRLSDYINERVDLLKIDIEGAESEVMRELAASGKLRMVERIAMEYHHHCLGGGDNEFSKMLAILEENGFGYVIHAPAPRPLKLTEPQPFMVYAYQTK